MQADVCARSGKLDWARCGELLTSHDPVAASRALSLKGKIPAFPARRFHVTPHHLLLLLHRCLALRPACLLYLLHLLHLPDASLCLLLLSLFPRPSALLLPCRPFCTCPTPSGGGRSSLPANTPPSASPPASQFARCAFGSHNSSVAPNTTRSETPYRSTVPAPLVAHLACCARPILCFAPTRPPLFRRCSQLPITFM